MVKKGLLKELQKDSAVPLYIQLAEAIEKAVQEGIYPEGIKIESEQEWMKRYQVSRVTVRQAMQSLLDKDIIIRKQGLGTFVRKRVITQQMDEISDFYPSLISKGLNPQMKTLTYEIISPNSEVQKDLQLVAGEKVSKITRQYLIGGSVFAVVKVYIPYALAKSWTKEAAFEKNTLRLLQENARLRIHNSLVRIMAVIASPQTGRLLGVPKGSPVLQARRVSFSAAQIPVENTIFNFRWDAYELTTRIQVGETNGLVLMEKNNRR